MSSLFIIVSCDMFILIVLFIYFLDVVAVGISAVGFSEEGNTLELCARESQPTPGPAPRGLQPGWLPRCPGRPPQHQWEVGEKIHTLSPTLHLIILCLRSF